MNISPHRLPALFAEESRHADLEVHGIARVLEFKIVSPDGRHHVYVQLLITKDARRPYGLWRKFKVCSSLTYGDTLWEATSEYDPGLIEGLVMMIEEKIEDLAEKAKARKDSVTLSLEMSRSISLHQVIRTQDSKYSFIVRIYRGNRYHNHV